MGTTMAIKRRDFAHLSTLAATTSWFGLAVAQEPLPGRVRLLDVVPKSPSDKFGERTPVASTAQRSHAVAIGAGVPEAVCNMRGFLAWARASRGRANSGSPGANGAQECLVAAAMVSSVRSAAACRWVGRCARCSFCRAGSRGATPPPVRRLPVPRATVATPGASLCASPATSPNERGAGRP